MALKVKIDLSISADWKTITVTDSTGSGITGYGNNQEPATLRRADASNVNIEFTQIVLTSPSNETYTFNLSASQAYSATINGYTIANTSLGYAADENIEEGIWSVSYTPYFANAAETINLNSTTTIVYSAVDTYFKNVNKFKINTLYYNVVSINLVTNTIIVNTATGATYTTYFVGYEAIEYLPIVKTLKDCLDSKIAALPASTCPCKEDQCNQLMNMYMLYDAMFINAANVNKIKAGYIYDILSNYCAHSDCNCND